MTSRSQSSPRRGASRQFSKSAKEKKSKDKKKRTGAKYLQEETPEVSAKEVADKTIIGLGRLGNQIFALSPFSQYFDDWLVNLRQIISEFESHPAIQSDEQFQKERTQIFLDIEGVLAENRLAESNLTQEAKALADNNHLIVQADKEYAEKTRDLSNKRNAELQRLSTRIREIEEELSSQQQIKFSFYKFGEKKKAAEKLAQTNQNLTSAKNQLEVTIQNFTAEQEKLHDSYEKRKQELNENSDHLHNELEKLETDTSTPGRLSACNALAESINGLLKRMPASAGENSPT